MTSLKRGSKEHKEYLKRRIKIHKAEPESIRDLLLIKALKAELHW